MTKPLNGYTMIELAGIGPCPFAGQLLADMGAEVILINRPQGPPSTLSDRGKKTMSLDLQTTAGVEVLLKLVKQADVLYEGLRPGVVERLGIDPQVCHAINAKLIYARMTGWGQTGPWAHTAGHDINYISITGALGAMGRASEPPTPPLNLVGDYAGGAMFLVAGILAALLKAERTGEGDVIDAAMIDGTSSLMSLFYSLSAFGEWQPQREANFLDGSMPYYRCYRTQDELFMAVGCIEAKFFTQMLALLEISPADYGDQNDAKQWPAQHALLEKVFATKTRAQWAALFDGTDACVSPVLNYQEAPNHPQNHARGGLKQQGLFTHPRSAPMFKNSQHSEDFSVPQRNQHTAQILQSLGYSDSAMTALANDKVIVLD